MMPLISRILGAVAALSLTAIAPAAELRPFMASFNVTWKGMSAGTSELELTHSGNSKWLYVSRSHASGLFRLVLPAELSSQSVFTIRDGLVIPEHFSGDDGTDSTQRDQDLRFDWNAGRVSGTAETRKVDIPVQPGVQDGMSIQIAMINDLVSGRTPTRVQMVDKDKVKEYLYTNEGNETLQTALGVQRTVVFRSARPNSEYGTWFWCAPDLGYLPVKVERRKGHKVQWSMAVRSAQLASGS
jgi:hypothetical protein